MDIQKELKEQTYELHKQAENHPVMASFIKGEYKKEQLLQTLVNLRPIYETVEQRLLVPHIHNNFDLCRSRLISKDIANVYKDLCKEGVDVVKYLTIFNSTERWVSDQWICSSTDLVADFYVRWLADLYGGRMLARSLSPYANSYSFTDVQNTMKNIRDIIVSCADYMESSAEDAVNRIVERAKCFFQYHVELFNTIESNS